MRWQQAAIFLTACAIAFICYGVHTAAYHQEWFVKSQKISFAVSADGENAVIRPHEPKFQPIPAGGMDSLYRLHFAKETLQTGNWRIRHTELDGLPGGRPVYWTSGMTWLMAGLSRVGKTFMKESPYVGDEDFLYWAAFWIHPVLFVLFTVAWVWTLLPVLNGRWLAALAAAWMSAHGLFEPLLPGSCDHHGLQMIFYALALVFLLHGMIQPKRRWWILAGVMAGASIWVQSLVTAPFLGVLAAAGWLVSWRNQDKNARLWETFCFAVAGSTFLLYLIEFFPEGHDQTAALHPVYSLAFLGMALAFGWLVKRNKLWKIIGGGALILISAGWWVWLHKHSPLGNPVILRLGESTVELRATWEAWLEAPLGSYMKYFGVLHLMPIALGYLIWKNKKWRPHFWPLLAVVLASGVLTAFHVRLISIHGAALWILSAAMAAELKPTRGQTILAGVFVVLSFASWGFAVEADAQHWGKKKVFPPLLQSIVQRQSARELKPWIENKPARPTRILSGGMSWNHLIFTAGAPMTCTLYWENERGGEVSALILGSLDDAEAKRLIQRYGITHLLVQNAPLMADRWFYARWGETKPELLRQLLPASLVARLQTGQRLPDWIERVDPHEIPFSSILGYRLYELVK